MLVVSLEGTYVLESDGRGGSVERPCRLARSTSRASRAERGEVLGTSTSAIRS